MSLYADVIRRFGLSKVAYVAWYRLSLWAGFRRRFFNPRQIDWQQDFFQEPGECRDYPNEWKEKLHSNAQRTAHGNLFFYERHWHQMGDPPEWFLNPFNRKRHPAPEKHWTKLKDFDDEVGDIKHIWESSRLEWIVTLARAWVVSDKLWYGKVLNRWLKHWVEKNPVNLGPNWKCGQEAAIRVMQLMFTAYVLRQWRAPSSSLAELISAHLERIQGNIDYAIAQDNNHGTSEAAALFIGGNWLARFGGASVDKGKSEFFTTQGRHWLENRLKRLVEPDGSFSQHSVNYHRMLLDTLIYAEFWRRRLEAPVFSKMFYRRAEAVLEWLVALTDPLSGGAPNLGGNDGTMLLCCHGCDYRDFRPTLQTASVVFYGRKYTNAGPWDEPLFWLGIDTRGAEQSTPEKQSKVFPGGYVIMAGRKSWALLRFPMYRHRPSHNDVFHFDLWYQGENICRDAGSYSYNPDHEVDEVYFTSVRAHNTVSFDSQDQMPRLGRFLMGKWIRADDVSEIKARRNGWFCWSGACTDYRGNWHQRKVYWRDDEWVVEDTLAGAFHRAEIRFRLIAGEYRLEGSRVISSWGRLEVSPPDCTMYMEKGMESVYYQEKSPVDVLVLRVGSGRQHIKTRFLLQCTGKQGE